MAATVKKEVDVETEEDKELKDELKSLVEKLEGKDVKLHLPALEMLRYLIRTATSSMTSVPKPLKFLAEYYQRIKNCHEKMKDDSVTKKACADIISVLAMGSASSNVTKEKRDCLNYCLIGTMNNIGDWGHEYVRQLEYEIAEEWTAFPEKFDTLLPLVNMVIDFDGKHHAEIQACDLLMEIDQLDLLEEHITKDTYQRICLYLASCANYSDETESSKTLQFVVRQYLKYKEYTKALLAAMQLRDDQLINKIFHLCGDISTLKQMAFIAGRQQICVEFRDDLDEKEELENITCNSYLNHLFNMLGRELDIMEPKTPEEIYKTWLEPNLRSSLIENLDSARQNLASSFVNAFINAGFGKDKLVTTEEGSKWIYRNKDHAMLSATASLGLIHLWDVDGGLTPIDKYLYASDNNIKAGALMALGIVNCRVKNECDPALALLSDYVLHKSSLLQIGSIFGLGLAYAGTNRQDVLDLLLPVIQTQNSSHEVLAVVCVSCGLIAVSSCDPDVSATILEKLIDNKDTSLVSNHYTRFMLLGLGLLYLGRRDAIETPSATLEVFKDPFRSLAQTILKMCAYAGTGDVLVIQEFLHLCSERHDPSSENIEVNATSSTSGSGKKVDFKKTDNTSNTKNKNKDTTKTNFCDVQAVAALGVALVSMGDDVGNKMSTRIFGHMAQYGDACMRKTVPLALALCSISNPQLSVIDILNKYSHDVDNEVSCNAIFAMGLVGAGTNNARLSTMLRQLASYHARNHGQLFMVRLAQGLIYLGRGTFTLNPFHTDKQLFCTTAVAGLLTTVFALVDSPNIIFGKAHYLLYSMTVAMQPRWLITLDEKMEQISVPVRVGQAVDIVAKAGTPKTIAGIHTHSTPVLLAVGERAELATDQYDHLTPIMEGIVILRKKEEEV